MVERLQITWLSTSAEFNVEKKNIHPVVKYSYSLYEENHAGVTEDIQDILLTFYFIKT